MIQIRRNILKQRANQYVFIIAAVFFSSIFVMLGDRTRARVTSVSFTKVIPVSSQKFQWQKIFHDFYIYSAYYANSIVPELHAVVMANVWDESFWRYTRCNCLFRSDSDIKVPHKSRLTRIMTARLERLSESHRQENRNMTAGRLRCLKPSGAASTFTVWKSVEFRCRYELQNRNGSASVPAPPSWEEMEQPPVLSFAHCGPPIFGYDRPASVIEFVEYYRLMGVSKFFWYQLQVSSRTQRVLDYYEQIGMMDVTKWRLPDEVHGRIHYFGQVALMYDCLLKSSHLFDYTIYSDLDEFFVTAKHPATFANIMNHGGLDCAIIRGAFMDPNATAFANYTDLMDPKTDQPLLFTSTVTRRDSFVMLEHRTKYICRGRHVDMPRIHFPKYYRGHPKISRPDPETELIFHMRAEHRLTNETMLDTRGTVHKEILEPRVNALWKTLFPKKN